jgi:prephenate dehydrogenase
MIIGIIGLGLIGGSLALALKEKNFSIWGVDINENSIKRFLRENIIYKGSNDINDVLDEIKKSHLIFISVHPSQVIFTIENIKSVLRDDLVLTDTSSVKKHIMNYVEEDNFLKRIFIGGHPLAGKEKSGYENSDSKLFDGKLYFLTPASLVSFEKKNSLEKILNLIGAKTFTISADEHDKIISYTSHLPQIVSYILSSVVLKKDLDLFVGTGFIDTTRLAKSPSELWVVIIRENKENILNSLDDFKYEMDLIYEIIKNNKWEELKEIFNSIREKRLNLEVRR